MIGVEQIERTVPVSDPEVRQLLGIFDLEDPDQAARRMVRQGIPHVRIGRRIRFSVPALRLWIANQINDSVAARAEAK
ncbi:MAG: helix-turn-helix domain-containing protein [Blastocatellia bacterium]